MHIYTYTYHIHIYIHYEPIHHYSDSRSTFFSFRMFSLCLPPSPYPQRHLGPKRKATLFVTILNKTTNYRDRVIRGFRESRCPDA